MKQNKKTNEYAWELFMGENNPNLSEYDSGAEGCLPECRNCRFHRPNWIYNTCYYDYCPYSMKRISTRRSKDEIDKLKGGNYDKV